MNKTDLKMLTTRRGTLVEQFNQLKEEKEKLNARLKEIEAQMFRYQGAFAFCDTLIKENAPREGRVPPFNEGAVSAPSE